MTGIPAGKTWFEGLKKSFVDVPVSGDQGINTSAFLEASEATTTLFGIEHRRRRKARILTRYRPARLSSLHSRQE